MPGKKKVALTRCGYSTAKKKMLATGSTGMREMNVEKSARSTRKYVLRDPLKVIVKNVSVATCPHVVNSARAPRFFSRPGSTPHEEFKRASCRTDSSTGRDTHESEHESAQGTKKAKLSPLLSVMVFRDARPENT